MVTAVSGCVITKVENGDYVHYQEKCDKCGTLGNMGSMKVRAFETANSGALCRKCRTKFKIVIKGDKA